MVRRWVAAGLAAPALIAGCGGSSSSPTGSAPISSPAASAPSAASAASPTSPVAMLGSSAAAWRTLRRGGHYRQLVVRHGRVVGFTRVFSPATSQVPAVDELQQSVLPRDAAVVDQGVLANCEVLVYRLPKAHPVPQLGREFGLRLYSGSGNAAFNPRHVTRAVVSPNILLVS